MYEWFKYKNKTIHPVQMPEEGNMTTTPTANLKAKSSDDNLSIDPSDASEKENEVSAESLTLGTQRKRSLVSLPSEGEEDEFLFSRLTKQIKGHWSKIMENYPNTSMLFRTSTTEKSDNETKEQNGISKVNRTDSITTSTSASTAIIEPQLISSAIKSVFLLPNFSCKRDDEGRRSVPFISSLLQVTKSIY